MKGISEIVSTIIILLIVITSASAFFYWYQTLEGQAMGTSSEFTTNMQKQIISTSTSLLDTYYSADKQANINNYGGTTETICANDRELDLSNSKIGFIMWEGWGSNKELICSSYSLPCGCVGVETDTLGAILVKSGGIGLVSTTDGNTWTVQKDSSSPISVSNPTLINVNSLEFIEGGDSCKNPPNIFISGSSCSSESCGNLNIIWDSDEQASSYNEEISYGANEIYWYDSVAMSINSAAWPSTLNKPRLIDDPQPTFLGGAAVIIEAPNMGAYAKALLAAKYSVYDTHSILGSFGSINGKTDASGITAIEQIIRNGENQLLIGVSKNPLSGSGYSYIDETVFTVDGTEKYYAGDMTDPLRCPYNIAEFGPPPGTGLHYVADGSNPNKILNCDLNSGAISSMLYDDRFEILGDGVIPDPTRPVYVGVSGIDLSAGGGPADTSKLIYTGRTMSGPTIFNIISDHGEFDNTEISDIIFDEAGNSIVVAANYIGLNKAKLIYFNNLAQPSFGSKVEIVGITITSLEYFDDRVWFGGSDSLGAVIYSVTGGVINMPASYQNAVYLETSNLATLTQCSEKAVHCSQGCDKTLAPGQCGDITLTFENTACDISNYPTGAQFSYSLNIGEHFTRSSIFEKNTAKTNELSVTIL